MDVSASSFFFFLLCYFLYMLYTFYCCVLFYYGYGWPRSFCLFPPDGVHIIYNYGFPSLLIIILLSRLHRLSPPTRSRFYKGGFLPYFY